MLLSLDIKNIALIEHLSIDFSSGMTVITGETGAGKSIIIDALGLALGDKTDNSVIRFDCDKADISACFDISQQPVIHAWLLEHALEASGECILRRQLSRKGRTRCFINGHAVPLNMLQEIGAYLIDIHGQHAHQSLSQTTYQLSLLDALLDNTTLLDKVRDIATTYQTLYKTFQENQKNTQITQERIALLTYQVQEFDGLNITADSVHQIEIDHSRAANAQNLLSASQNALTELYDTDNSLHNQLTVHLNELTALQDKDPNLKNSVELLQNSLDFLQESISEIRRYHDAVEYHPEELSRLDDELSQLHDLSRKHHVTLEQLPDTIQQLHQELKTLTSTSEHQDELKTELEILKNDYQTAAKKLSKARKNTATSLANHVQQEMQQLGMDGGQFKIQLESQQSQVSLTGNDVIEFQVSANPGQPLMPLSKVASGGELSRISLAIQVITAQKKVTPCLIFDEVDVGIGGKTADIVGRKLKSIAQHTQVLCVTHQPQVAARGNQHLLSKKTKSQNHTHVNLDLLSKEERIEEIARMVGGQSITDNTLEHAKELLGAV